MLKATEAKGSPDDRLTDWLESNKVRLARALDMLEELKRDTKFDLARLAVANRQMRALITA